MTSELKRLSLLSRGLSDEEEEPESIELDDDEEEEEEEEGLSKEEFI